MEDKPEELLPRGVAISWGLVKDPQRGPKREMSVEQIVQTAVDIADKEGLAAVSMSRVAAALGFTTMSLYRYVPGKDDLLLLMQDTAAGIPIPPVREGMHWRERMREYVWANIGVFRDHPWLGDIPISGVPVAPNQLRIVDWALRTTRELPLNEFEKMSIVLLLSSYARACGLIQRDMERAIQAGASPGSFTGLDYSAALKRLVKPDSFPDLYPVVQSGGYTGENETDNTVGDDFNFGLERILDGIEHYVESKRRGESERREKGKK